ncbi:MAG TPA: hypothetical protein VFN96_01350, partial [Gemmatimonadales bacterium]|nr:hypothetical protein [Gemmatimonadales bacterium]
MGPGFLIVAALAAQSPDTTIYSSAATRDLIARAAARHRAQDTSVRDYRAKFHYRLTASMGRRKWGSAPPWAAEEQEGRVAWQLPGDLRIEIGGQRSRTRDSRGTLFSAFDQPWFVPRSLSDSVRLFGSDFPERASLHPLAPSGPDWYRYAGGDTITLTTSTGRQLRITRVEVVPRRPGPALLAGQLWIDLASAEVVRFAFRYIGTDLWILPEGETRKDSAEARKANRRINRVLSLDADLEYALQDGRHWMPYRQVLSGRVQVPLIGDVFIPFEAVTTFSDYAINTGEAVAFRLPPPDPLRRRTPEEREARRDSLRSERRGRAREDTTTAREWAGRLPDGGRFEIRRAPRDSLRTYAGWEAALELQVSDAEARRTEELRREVADLVESLPRDVSGTSVTGFGFERLADAFRFNRVQGGSVG